jgi:hypothetical protein
MTFFKDFNKDVKDLLTKYTAEAKGKVATGFAPLAWKVESKLKTKAGAALVFNPVFDEASSKINAEFTLERFVPGVKGKLSLDRDLAKTKPTLTFEPEGGRKVEASVETFFDVAKYEIVYEDKQTAYTAIVKATPGVVAIEDSLPIPGVDGVVLGGSVELDYTGAKDTKTLKSWAAGLRWAPSKTLAANVTTAALKTFTLGALFEIPEVKLEGKPIAAAAQVDFDAATNKVKAIVGISARTPLCPFGSSFKVKVDTALNVSLSYIADFTNWKLSATFDVNQRALGLLVTLE